MKAKKLFKTFLAMMLITVTIIGFGSIPVGAKVTVLYTPPFEDHDRWYTGIGGSATHGVYIWGYLNSANSYLNLVYEDGIAYVSPTGKSVTDKAFWEGHCIGWLEMVYAYDEPIEIDLNQAVLEYDIEMPREWTVKLYFQDLNGNESPTPFMLSIPVNVLASDNAHGKPGSYKGSINMLEAIQKYYITVKKEWGLTLDSKVRLSRISIVHSDYYTQEVSTSIIKKLRIVKDTSLPDIFKPVTTTEEPSQTSATTTTEAEITTTTSSAATTGTVDSPTETTKASGSEPAQGKPFYKQPLFIALIIIAAIAIFAVYVIILIRIKAKQNSSKPKSD
jgi:hypothetical protein